MSEPSKDSELRRNIKHLCIVPKTLKQIKGDLPSYPSDWVEDEVKKMLENGTLFYATEDKIGRTRR